MENASKKIENILNAQSLSSFDLQNTITELKKSRDLNINKLQEIDFNANGNDNNDGLTLMKEKSANINNDQYLINRLDYKIYQNLSVDDLAEYGFEVI